MPKQFQGINNNSRYTQSVGQLWEEAFRRLQQTLPTQTHPTPLPHTPQNPLLPINVIIFILIVVREDTITN
jgi:hypothetical protein